MNRVNNGNRLDYGNRVKHGNIIDVSNSDSAREERAQSVFAPWFKRFPRLKPSALTVLFDLSKLRRANT
jgi:hypothetical protein